MQDKKPEMNIRRVVMPRHREPWPNFVATYPPGSVGLDGFCTQCHGRTVVSHIGPHMNIDHHGSAPFLERSTIKQCMLYAAFGLHETTFTKDSVVDMTLYGNDADEDMTGSFYVMEHPEVASRPKMIRFVNLEDALDMSAGLYLPSSEESKLYRTVAWVFQPYHEVRLSQELYQMDAAAMNALIDEMHERIRLYLVGKEERLTLNTDFETISEHDGWTFVREIGAQAKMGMALAKIRAYAVHKGEVNGRHVYALGRVHDAIPFPTEWSYAYLNAIEGIDPNAQYRWGGSGNRGGSPLGGVNSGLSPDELVEGLKMARAHWFEWLKGGPGLQERLAELRAA